MTKNPLATIATAIAILLTSLIAAVGLLAPSADAQFTQLGQYAVEYGDCAAGYFADGDTCVAVNPERDPQIGINFSCPDVPDNPHVVFFVSTYFSEGVELIHSCQYPRTVYLVEADPQPSFVQTFIWSP